MGLHTADAIVLRQYPYRETSVIVSCMTDRYGRLKGLIKGLRARPTRHRSAMEPGTVNRIVFYDTQTSALHLISECELLDPLTGLARDLDTARTAAFCLDLVETLMPPEDPHPQAYALLKQGLEGLAVPGGNPLEVRLHYMVRLLRLSGFQPQLDQCTGCAMAVRAEGYWSARQGGLLCARCLHDDPKAQPTGPALLTALEALSHADQPVALEAPTARMIRQRVEEFLQWRLDRPLKTLAT